MTDLVKLWDVGVVPDYRPSWLPADVETLSRGTLELGYCLDYHPGPFAFGDIEHCVTVKADSPPDEALGEGDYVWDVTLKNGERYRVEGWHDFTGWDCQSGAEYHRIVSERP